MKHKQHLKHKKNFTKPLKKKEQLQANQNSKAAAASSSKGGLKKVFGKPVGGSKALHKKRRDASTRSIQPAVKETELDDETVRDILENVAEDDDEYDDDVDVPRHNVKKRKRAATDHDAEDEAKYAKRFEKEHAQLTLASERTKKRVVSLLPIKTKAGDVVTRTAEMDYKEEDNEHDDEEMEEEQEEEIEEEIDSDDDILKDKTVSFSIERDGIVRLMQFFVADVNRSGRNVEERRVNG